MTSLSKTMLLALLHLQEQRGELLNVVGGTVRDLLLGCPSADVDVAVTCQPKAWAQALVRELGGGVVVPLSEAAGEEAARVVWQSEQVDFTAFREGTTSLEADLRLRDFSLNALALPLACYAAGSREGLVDPCGGAEDLRLRRLRHLPGAFGADPLRMLRGYRFAATLGFALAEGSRAAVTAAASAIGNVAEERRSYELRLIFESPRTAETVALMAEDGLLRYLLPELYQGEGVSQPREFHHLGVLEHCLLALTMAEKIISAPEMFFSSPDLLAAMREYLVEEGRARRLKWAALLHDIGKPATKGECAERGRTTFYGHDQAGREIFEEFAERSRWSAQDRQQVARLIEMHMHPFHLVAVQRKEGLSKKAALKLSRKAGKDLFGLFLLAMADCLAGHPRHQKLMSGELVRLFVAVEEMYHEDIQPVTKGEALLSGRDLIALGLSPGPIFSTIFAALEEAQVERTVANRQEAFVWLETFLRQEGLSNYGKKATTCVK